MDQHRYIKKSTMIKIAVAIMCLLALRACFHHHGRSSINQDQVVVNIERVKQGSAVIETHAIGTLTAAKNIQVSPEIAGMVAKVFFEDGGFFVKQGTPLVQLDDAALKAKLISDQANLTYSETDYKRKAFLGKHGAIAQQMIDQALADMKTKQAEVQQSQVNVDRMKLTAPFDGEIGKINVSPGDYVTPGQKIVSLTDIRHLHVEYAISEKYLSQLKLGQAVKITTTAYPGKEFIGKVAYISPTIDMENRTIAVYAEVPNDQKLLTSGLFVTVIQQLGTENNVLLVSPSSLVPTIDGQQVFKIVNNKAVAVPVTLGQRTQNSVQITSGLSSGDVIVIAGQEKLKDGASVQIEATGIKS